MVDNEIFDGLAMPKKANVILFTFQIDGKYIEKNALSYCKLFMYGYGLGRV
jgi:hypothetical protein